jgi:sodium pump decarboxylase gamma subunit
MVEILKQGLLITAVGMGIVFAMILILWGIMVLLVRLTNRTEKEEPAEEIDVSLPEPVVETAPGNASALAAAIAVAYALSAKPKTVFASDTQSIQTGSTWLAAGRAQQIARQSNRGRSA